MCVPLIYIYDFCIEQKLIRIHGIYMLSMIGIMIGFGRIISVVSYRVNKSDSKSRIFAYVLTLILAGLSLICSIFLCDTVFSFVIFSISFGFLSGK